MDDQEKLAHARAIATGAGRLNEHLAFVVGYLDRREAELLERATQAETNVDFLVEHSGQRQTAELENRCAAFQTENEQLWQRVADLVIERDIAIRTVGDETLRDIAQIAIEWGRAIHNLEQARKKDNDQKKKGGESVYKANQAYTKAHLALKAALKPAITGP